MISSMMKILHCHQELLMSSNLLGIPEYANLTNNGRNQNISMNVQYITQLYMCFKSD